MRESRRLYSLTALDISQLNLIFNMLADRIDELEGRRGTPTFKSDIDMEGNKITDLATAVADSDGLRKDQLDTDIDTHEAATDPHIGYRLESADHNHQSTGAQAGQLDHGLAMTAASMLDNDHPQYALTDGSNIDIVCFEDEVICHEDNVVYV